MLLAASLALAALPWATAARSQAGGGPGADARTRLTTVPVTTPNAATGRTLRAADLTAVLGEQPQSIRRVHYPNDISTVADGPFRWRVLVYFDAPLATPDGLRQAALALAREADRLTRLGPTDIVVADPHPRTYLQTSTDPLAVKEALRDVRSEAVSVGELQWHRQRLAMATETAADDSLAARTFGQEVAMLETQRQVLLRWLAERGSAGPKLLILVQNGFDLNPRAFYSQHAGETFLEDPRVDLSQTRLARSIAAAGWTVVPLALGPRPDEFADPSAPLFETAHATGGQVVTRKGDVARLLDRARTWPILVVELSGPTDGKPRPFAVRDGDSGGRLDTTRWASVARPWALADVVAERQQDGSDPSSGTMESRPALQLLRPEGLTQTGKVRFRTIAGRRRIDRVVFLLDGREVAESERSPFAATIDLGPAIRPCTVSAVAYSKSGRRLGEDSLDLNRDLEPPRVTITLLEYDPGTGRLAVTASATAPSGMGPERVEFFLNEQQLASFAAPPYAVHHHTEPLDGTDFVRVVAHYPSGHLAEAARLPAAPGPADELDVNLVELLAMVTPRNRKGSLELDKSDFLIRHQDRPQLIDQFSRWEDLQLTLGLVIDTSESMEVVIEDAREAGERFFHEALAPGDEAFVVDFANMPHLARHVTTDSDQLLHSLEGLEARGNTALYDAIVFSLQQFENTVRRRALVVVTDGDDSASFYQPQECVRQARLHGVPVYLITLAPPPDPSREPSLLRNQMIARRSGGEIYHVSDLEDLSRIYDQIIKELRRQYFLAFNSGHTLTPQELEEIEVEVVRKGVEVRTLLASQQRGG